MILFDLWDTQPQLQGGLVSFAFAGDRQEEGEDGARMSPLSLAHPYNC